MPIDINLLRTDAGTSAIQKYKTQLNILLIGNDPNVVKQSEERRFRDPALIDQIMEIDAEWRKCKISFQTNY